MRTQLHIGEIAQLLGITPKAIRHYQKVGLLAEPERSEAGYPSLWRAKSAALATYSPLAGTWVIPQTDQGCAFRS